MESELDKLRARVKQLEDECSDLRRQAIDHREESQRLENLADQMEAREDSLLREREIERAKRRRRDRDAFEKATRTVRTAAVRELAKLLPAARKQAAGGKPALLRLILRATR